MGMKRIGYAAALALALTVLGWVGAGFVGHNAFALAITLAIAAGFAAGVIELQRFRAATDTLVRGLEGLPPAMTTLGPWLDQVHPSLRQPVRLRIEGDRVALPGPALTPYLVGLLVMLGMLGTFLGMVQTFRGAELVLQGSADLQAMRAALATPLRGLGLSFGTSVAGVAASAALGLMAALSRRERLEAGRRLDQSLATVLRPFSRADQQQTTLEALQRQSEALPAVAGQLQGLVQQIERRNDSLNQQLEARQAEFHRDMTQAYTRLAQDVGQALRDNLSVGAQSTAELMRPMVETTLSGVAEATLRWLEQAQHDTKAQIAQAVTELGAGARTLMADWDQAQQRQLDQEQARWRDWEQSIEGLAATVQREWQGTAQQVLSRQQAVLEALERSAAEAGARVATSLVAATESAERSLRQSEALATARQDAEAQWIRQQGERMEEITALWQRELGALRADEAVRAQVAAERIDQLQRALAAQVQAQRDRDQLDTAERARLAERLAGVLESLDQAAQGQRATVDALMASATTAMAQASQHFTQALDGEAARASALVDQVGASAIELESLGQALQQALRLFGASNEQLIAGLQQVEAAVNRSLVRSDEQLAYYVSQAREVIDLSLGAQREIVDTLGRVRHAAPVTHEAAGA
jgi:hypothetical protein